MSAAGLPDPRLPDIVKRTTMIVRDAEAAADWYGHVFGMSRAMDTPFTLTGRQLAAGQAGDRTRLILMQARDAVIGMIGLLEWVDPRIDFKPLPTRIAPGTPIFVIEASDCRATVERARAAGGRIHCEPYDWTVTGFDGRPRDLVGASFWDLDGHFFEVNAAR